MLYSDRQNIRFFKILKSKMQRFTCTWKCKGLHVYGRIIKIKYCYFWCSISLQAKLVFFDETCFFIQFENNEVVWKKHYSNPFTTEFFNFRKSRLYTGKWNRLDLPKNLEFMHCKEPQFLTPNFNSNILPY